MLFDLQQCALNVASPGIISDQPNCSCLSFDDLCSDLCRGMSCPINYAIRSVDEY